MLVLSLLLTPSGAMIYCAESEETSRLGGEGVHMTYEDGKKVASSLAGIGGAGHPRLFLKKGEESAVKTAVGKYPALKKMHDAVMDCADEALAQPPVTRQMIGIRLLETSRESLKRVFALSYAYRMTGDMRYARRAEKEMLACCEFSDWNPSHFLDVAEMSVSMSVGYDWLYDELSMETRAKVEQAVFEKAFKPLETESQPWYGWTSNWNSVCNAGMTVAAVVFYDINPELCGSIILRSLESNPKAMAVYAPDGGYPEGAMYWGYGSSFEIIMIEALEGACGTDFGLAESPGFLQSGRFLQAMLTPRGGCFNYSDASYGPSCDPMLFWIASRTGDTALLYNIIEYLDNFGAEVFAENRLLPLAVISAAGLELGDVASPDWNIWFSRGETPVFAYRSGWKSADDTYFGLKGGSPSSGHAHMDGGSFIYERDSVRWALDLGMQDYGSLEKYGLDIWSLSQDSGRWRVFRYGNMGHNTVSVLDSLHCASGRAEIVDTMASVSKKGAVADLSSLLPQFVKVTRTAFLDPEDNLHIEDVFENGNSPQTVVWKMNTEAVPEIVSENEVRMRCRGHEMLLTFEAASPFSLEIVPADPPAEYDAPNPGVTQISLEMGIEAGKTEKVDVYFQKVRNAGWDF